MLKTILFWTTPVLWTLFIPAYWWVLFWGRRRFGVPLMKHARFQMMTWTVLLGIFCLSFLLTPNHPFWANIAATAFNLGVWVGVVVYYRRHGVRWQS